MKRRAFTLIELLVVISIIGLLSTVAVVATNSSRAKARNTKRVADVKQLVSALNLAYGAGGFPDTTGAANGWDCISTACVGGWNGFSGFASVDSILFGATGYMKAKPNDPTDTTRGLGGYVYTSNWTGGSNAWGTASPGATVSYVLEGATACGYGFIWSQSSSLTQCVVAVDGRF